MTPSWFTRELTAGDSGRDVAVVQRLLGLSVSGEWGDHTTVALRGAQRAARIAPTGVVDEETATMLGERATSGLTPDWFTRPVHPGSDDIAVDAVSSALGLVSGASNREWDSAVRRFQSQYGLDLTGVVDEATARLIGDV